MIRQSTQTKFLRGMVEENLKNLFYDSINENNALGKDGVSYSKFESNLDNEIEIIVRKVRNGTYSFTDYKEKLISKGFEKFPRQLSIPTIRDRLILKYLSKFLAEIYASNKPPVPQSIVKSVKALAGKADRDTFFLRMDVKSYYPKIDHAILLSTLRKKIRSPIVLNLVEQAISTPTGNANSSKPLGVGVPQGLSISNILAHVYLMDLDDEFRAKFNYFRYVDDIVVVASKDEASRAEKLIRKSLKKKRNLDCHSMEDSSKSALVSVGSGVDYLGYRFVGGRLSVRKSSYDRMFSNLMKIITNTKHHKDFSSGLFKLNLRITGCRFEGEKVGWLNYFSQITDMHQLKKLDLFVSKNAKNIFPEDDVANIKSFIKAYHEIAFNFRETIYIPSFDGIDAEEKRRNILLLDTSIPTEKVDGLSDAEAGTLFERLLKREVRDIERDVLSVLS